MPANATSPRFYAPGWVLVPLRCFLGVTFVYAGLQKLADRHFFVASAPSSIQSQLHAYARHSPVRGLLVIAQHHAVAVGLLIALGEMAVGLGALLGLWTRAAAIGGMVLALSFLLTVSWHSDPYYLGSDVVFLFAWTPLVLAGAGNVLSLDAALRARARHEMRLGPAGPVVIDFAAIRKWCGAYDKGTCRLRDGAPCEVAPCPVLGAQPTPAPAVAAELGRRTFLRQAGAAAAASAAALVLGSVVAAIGRLVPTGASSRHATSAFARAPTPPGSGVTTPPGSQVAPPSPPQAGLPAGTPIGRANVVPVGGAASFTDPASGEPALVIQPEAGRFVAFSAVCTHRGCPVEFSQVDNAFVCPCHRAAFSASTGEVLQGPARQPLPSISVKKGTDGQLYVDG